MVDRTVGWRAVGKADTRAAASAVYWAASSELTTAVAMVDKKAEKSDGNLVDMTADPKAALREQMKVAQKAARSVVQEIVRTAH